MHANLLLVLALSLFAHGETFASKAAVYGPEAPHFANVENRADIPERINTLWKHVNKLFGLGDDPGPIVYLYPFGENLDTQPSLLRDLYTKGIAPFVNNPRQVDTYNNRVYGITYDENLYAPGVPERGRVIQVNTRIVYVNEPSQVAGYGLYITLHEMMHYAMRKKKIEVKYDHCVMGYEKNGRSITLALLEPALKAGWISPNLADTAVSRHGYVESPTHCRNDMRAVVQAEGPDALENFHNEVERISLDLLK